MKDYVIIENIINGNKEQYSLLMNKYHNELFTYIYNICGDYTETEDILQEIFINVYNNLKKYNKDKASFRTWLYRVSNNYTLNYVNKASYKQNKQTAELEDFNQSNSEDIEKDLVKEEQINQILQAMKKVLKPKHQQIMTLHYFSDLSVQEISEIMNIPDKTIYHALHSSVKKIQKEVA